MAPAVVAGFDGSPTARQAVRYAADRARGGRLVVVHAREAAPPHIAPRWKELLDHEHIEKGEAVLESILREGDLDLGNVALETRLVPGRPAEAIIAVARDVGADMIVAGSHGYSPISSILGSVSRDLVRTSDIPVTIIPPACAERMASEEQTKTVA